MNQVAEVVGVHETTVSRAIANKYVQTPYGLFDLKYFFTPGYQTATGEVMSNTSVKDAISDLIGRESTTKPLSDQEIVKILSERGIPLARRTVAKYRANWAAPLQSPAAAFRRRISRRILPGGCTRRAF